MMTPLSELFDVRYGHSLELNSLRRLQRSDGGVAFVSRKMGDNGISAYVAPIPGVEPSPPGLLTCALGGNGVMSTFLQEDSFYSGRDTAILYPKSDMTKQQLLFYCCCLLANRYRFSYGRQANRTLKNILVPSLDELPEYVKKTDVDRFGGGSLAKADIQIQKLTTQKWKLFRYDEIFVIKKGYYNKKPPTSIGNDCIPFIGATENNNGITSYIAWSDLKKFSRDGTIDPEEHIARKLFPANCITVSNNGSVGEAFYQPIEFTCSHDVNPLYLKDKKVILTPAIGLFLAAVIRADKYRWGFGRKWRPIRMPDSIIKLPVTNDGSLDWRYMEHYIHALPYSSQV